MARKKKIIIISTSIIIITLISSFIGLSIQKTKISNQLQIVTMNNTKCALFEVNLKLNHPMFFNYIKSAEVDKDNIESQLNSIGCRIVASGETKDISPDKLTGTYSLSIYISLDNNIEQIKKILSENNIYVQYENPKTEKSYSIGQYWSNE